jgi:hypothetical protein
VVTGATNLAAISVTEDHLVAVTIFLFNSSPMLLKVSGFKFQVA